MLERSVPSRRKRKSKRAAGTTRSKSAAPAKDSVAVALEYKPENAYSAPRVVASGRGWIAEKILEIAFAEGVRVREDPDLAEMLAAVDLESEIPVEAFIAVAEILRYVYAANGTAPPEVPQP